jgi:deoxyribodipyrimidine photolyase
VYFSQSPFPQSKEYILLIGPFMFISPSKFSKTPKSQNSFCALKNRHWIQVHDRYCLHESSVSFSEHRNYFDFLRFYLFYKNTSFSKTPKSQNSFCALKNRHWIQVHNTCSLHESSVGFSEHINYFDFLRFYLFFLIL